MNLSLTNYDRANPKEGTMAWASQAVKNRLSLIFTMLFGFLHQRLYRLRSQNYFRISIPLYHGGSCRLLPRVSKVDGQGAGALIFIPTFIV